MPGKITDKHVFDRKPYHTTCVFCGLESEDSVHVQIPVSREAVELVVKVVETLMKESGEDFKVTPEVQRKATEMIQAGLLPGVVRG